MSLVAKLIEIAKEVPYIGKQGYNEAQSYKYVSEAQVTARLRDLFLDRGILVYPKHRLAADPIVNEKGRIVTTIESTWTFREEETNESIEVTVIGQGADNGDKGPFKAMTGNKKYGLLQLLLIATGDDPEEERLDESDDDRATVVQLNRLASEGQAIGLEGEKLRDFVKDATGKEKSSDLTKDDMEKLFAALEVLRATEGKVEA